MKHEHFPWLILFLPLLRGGGHHAFHAAQQNRQRLISIGAIVTGFVLTLVFIHANGFHVRCRKLPRTGCPSADLQVDFGLKLDALSLMMLLIVTGVGGAIHIYSYGYMDDDRA